MKHRRPAWIAALAIAFLATVLGLWLVTDAVRTLEQQQSASQAGIARAEAMRLALWRMDGWMAPRLAREAARPTNEYAAFFSPVDAVNKLLQSVPQGEVLSPSPLLFSSPDWIPIHFELRPDGSLTSPQVPQGNLLDLAEGQYFEKGVPIERAAALERLRGVLGKSEKTLEACAVAAELSNEAIVTAWTAASTQREKEPDSNSKLAGGFAGGASKGAIDDYASRARASNSAQQFDEKQIQSSRSVGRTATQSLAAQESAREVAASQVESQTRAQSKDGLPDQTLAPSKENRALTNDADESALSDAVGPFVATWLSTDPPELAFVRRVREGGASRVQGFLVDWTRLSALLLAQVSDLASDLRLMPVTMGIESFAPARLATIPAELHGEFLVAATPLQASSTPALFFAWGAAALALIAAAFSAWTSISFGERQARFASSVTHELRTPLTTFQLYAEMLRDGMVTDEARRKECLDTLCRESIRLSHLVENVLSLSRLERGAARVGVESGLSGDDLARLVDAIAVERAAGARCAVSIALEDQALWIDRDALTQILANLLENAAKYGCDASTVAKNSVDIEVSARADSDTLVIRVRDHGPGVSARAEEAIWRPFDRAGKEGGTQFGLGLGLSVSRALAEGLGGTLVLVPNTSATPGACFELRVPRSIVAG